MSTEPDKTTGCPIECDNNVNSDLKESVNKFCVTSDVDSKKKKSGRSVRFPDEDLIVTEYFEPENPWQDAAAVGHTGVKYPEPISDHRKRGSADDEQE
ncbi:unnamed protein product [Spodoptera exigua]|nr:unnamed protein product [Spodoptera exigua]